MSIAIIGCRCAGSEPRMRTFLRESGYAKWQNIPMPKGREASINFLDSLPSDNVEIKKLKEYLKRTSSWSVIIGTDGVTYQWADIGHGALKEKLDAEIIVRDFGNE